MSESKKTTTRSKTPLPKGISIQNNNYRVRLFFEGRQLGIGTYDTLGDAVAALTIAKSEKARGIFVPPAERLKAEQEKAAKQEAEKLTFAEWSERWLESLRDKDASESSIATHRSTLGAHILEPLGSKRLADITPEDINALVAKVRAIPSKHHPGATANGITPSVVRTLRACFNVAVKQGAGGLTVSPVTVEAPARRVRPKDPKGDVATPQEVEVMAAGMPEHLAIAVPLAAWCAMRLGEVLGLERHDLEHLDDPEKAILHIRRQVNSKAPGAPLTPPKADSIRSIAIPEFMLPALRAHLEQHTGPQEDSPVITNPTRRATRVSQTQFDNAWRKARAAAGRPVFRFHDLRHTGLTVYAQQGATMAELLNRGGHTDVSVALRYQHATAERDRALTAKLSQIIQD